MANELKQLAIALAERSQNITDASELLAVAAAIKNLEENIINVVPTYADIPPKHTIPDGSIWLVEDEDLVYFKKKEGLFDRTSIQNLIYAWGDNDVGQLGLNTLTEYDFKNSPVVVAGNIVDWEQVAAAGYAHTIALRKDGTAWSWGVNNSGQLGTNNCFDYPTTTYSPVQIAGNLKWKKVSSNRYTSFGITKSGSLWSWGNNVQGDIGDGTEINRSSPVEVLGGFTDWCDVGHSIGLRENNTLWIWGFNTDFRLGNGEVNTNLDVSSPIQIAGEWCEIGSGISHNLAIRTNGTLWAWGWNGRGQLGNNTTVNASCPIQVGSANDWKKVSASDEHVIALKGNGTLWAWGGNSWGELGDGTKIGRSTPVQVLGGFTDWCQISAGTSVSAGIRTNGTLWTWGSNSHGQLGNGGDTWNDCRCSPVEVLGGFTDWCQVSVSNAFNSSVFAIRVQ